MAEFVSGVAVGACTLGLDPELFEVPGFKLDEFVVSSGQNKCILEKQKCIASYK